MNRYSICLVAIFSLVAVIGCSKDSSTGTGVTCGTGTHDGGAGACVIDNAYAIVNTTSNYWRCNQNSVGNVQFLSDGTGKFAHSIPPGTLTTTWAETTGHTDGITFSSGANNYTFSSIVPNALTGAVSFTGLWNGVSTSCALVNTAFP